MTLLPSLSHLLAPWARLYADSKVISTGVTFAHVGGLLLGGGCAVAGDRITLRFGSIDPVCQQNHLEERASLHHPVLIGLGVTLVSGVLLLASDLETFLPSLVFWAKMALIVALFVNGAMIQRADRALRNDPARSPILWQRLQRAARVSLALWFAVTLLGTALLSI
jgi:hypothetical protein